jgi:arylsulfatase A-like enzyme
LGWRTARARPARGSPQGIYDHGTLKPNVLLIVFDTARADAFEPYGAPAGSTPVFAELASAGATLPGMHANACWTVPSHASIFTGRLPREAGLIKAPGGMPQGCRPVLEAQRGRLLPEVLRSAGYTTGGVSTNLWITEDSGFSTGFDRWVTVDTRRQAELSRRSLRHRAAWVAEGLRARADDGAGEAEEVLTRWIDEAPTGPFFWFVNLVEAHSPYLPPKPYNDLGPIGRARASIEAQRHLTMGEIWRACAGGFDVPEPALARMRRLYAASIRLMDDWLGRLLERLDVAKLLDDTLVVVTSDHGENFGESGLMGHAYSLDQRLIHVPFASRGPGAFDAPSARGLVDLPAMIADALDLEPHPWGGPADGDGVAVAQLDPPATAGDPRIAQALETWGLGPEAEPRITTELTAATDGRLKLLRRGGREELYDLRADPLELAPFDPDGHPEQPAIQRLRDGLAGEAVARPPAELREPEDDGTTISDAERARLEERMRLLGYM